MRSKIFPLSFASETCLSKVCCDQSYPQAPLRFVCVCVCVCYPLADTMSYVCVSVSVCVCVCVCARARACVYYLEYLHLLGKCVINVDLSS